MIATLPTDTTTTAAAPTGCQLGRHLEACALRRHCGSLYDVLFYLYPPADLLVELRTRQNSPAVDGWLRRLDSIGGRAT